ncbi:MAG: ABC transporter ATP-binding protein/permease [Lachnospiraceae bacterium]|nr:ABC transporter ATP-binding protein/permease [Lachnospiraceae bacterium]
MADRNRNRQLNQPKDTKGTIRRLLIYIMAYRHVLLLVMLLCILSNVLSLFGPSLAGKAINEAAAGAGKVNFSSVLYYVRRMLLFYVSSALLSYVINVIMMHVGRWLGNRMRQDVFHKLMKLPVSYFDRNQAGDIISRVSYDIDVITTSFSTDLVQIMTNVVTVGGSLIMMLLISPRLVLITLITVPLAVFYTRRMGRITKPLFSRRSAKYGEMNGYVEEMFSGHKTILAYAHEDAVAEDFDAINADAAEYFYKSEYYGMTIGPSVGFINNLGLSLICMFGSILYLYKQVSLGQISSFVLYSRKFSGPINEIANIMNELYSALAAAERVFRLLNEEEEIPDVENAKVLKEVRGQVEIDHLSFGYDPGKIILHDLNLKVKPGEMIAIVGPTGAGKTTIINLLMRFYDPNSGTIRVDGVGSREVTRESLRKAYAMVLQDTWVFKGTVFDNIAYGKEDATMEEVVAAAKAARIHSYIKRLPKGYQTVIGEDGGNISKGQKQMLTIARAFLYDAKILILDEATSNVDTTTEQQIQKAMRDLMADKTCFVIAHRLSTIQNADHILVLDHGDIVEQGTHETLMEAKGFYYDLYQSQFVS